MYRKVSLLLCLLALCSWAPDGQRWIFMIHADSGQLTENRLEIKPSGNTVAAVSEGPNRQAVTLNLDTVVKSWQQMFGSSPPNAAISYMENGKAEEVIVVLKGVDKRNGTLNFQIKQLGQVQTASINEMVIFVDGCILINGGQGWSCGYGSNL